jgi:hypothetical protein
MHKYDNELRQKMESMNALPSTCKFDAASTWQKMENQLQGPNKKKLGWVYWAAASIVFIVASVIMIGSNKHQAEEMVTGTTKENKKQPNKPIAPNTIAIVNGNRIISNSKEQKNAASLIKEQAPAANTKKEQTILVDSINKQQISIVQANNIIEIVPSVSNTIPVKQTIVAIKKPRLKVIHINELDAPPPPVIAKLESKKQLLEQDLDDATEPNKPFWQKRPRQVNTSSFIDNP